MGDQPEHSTDESEASPKQIIDDPSEVQDQTAPASVKDPADAGADARPSGEGSTDRSPRSKRKRKKRPSSRGIAMIGGTFGVLGALIGGGVTGAVSYFTTNRQINSAATQSSVQFYRQQKLTLYAQLAQDSTAASASIDHFMYQFSVTADPRSAEFLKVRTDAYDSLGKVKNDYESIRLVGGKPAVAAALNLWTVESAQATTEDDLLNRWGNDTLSEDDRRNSYVAWSPPTRASIDAQDKFAEVARQDLDSTR